MLSVGTLTEADARRLAGGQTWDLDDDQTQQVAAYAMQLYAGDEAATAWALAAALLAVVDVQPDRDQWWRQAATLYVLTTTRFLTQISNATLFLRASEVCDSLIAAARQVGDKGWLGISLVLSGQLRHDPYAFGPFPLREWLDRDLLSDRRWLRLWETGLDDAAHVEQMPHPGESIARAVRDLREATEIGDPMSLGQAIFVASQVFVSAREVIRPSVPSETIAHIATRGLELIQRESAPDGYLGMVRALQVASPRFDVNAFTLRPVPYASLIEAGRTSEFLLAARFAVEIAVAAGRADLIRALLDEIRPLFPSSHDTERQILLDAALHALPEDPTRCPAPGKLNIRKECDRLRKQGKRDRWTDRQLASALAHLAAHAAAAAAGDGMDLLREIDQVDSSIWSSESAEPLISLCATLEYANGRKRERASDLVQAAGYYAASTGRWADLGINDRALEGLVRVDRCIERGGLDASLTALPIISNVALELSMFAQRDPEQMIHWICCHACGDLRDDLPTRGMLTVVHQMAKGRDFSIATTPAGPVQIDAGEQQLLDMIAEASAKAQPRPDDQPRSLEGEIVMATYFWTPERVQREGVAPDPVVRLQRAFDLDHHRRLRWRGRTQPDSYLWLEPLQKSLPGNTILVSVFVGTGKDGALVQGMAVTRDSVDLQVLPLGEPTMAGGTFLVHPLSYQCERLREAIRDDPLFRNVSREAQTWLETETARWIGFTGDQLMAWRAAGRDHLCIWPHGPLHFAPFHLLSPGGKPLADSWTITVVPGVSLLKQSPVQNKEKLRILVAASSTGGKPFGLPVEEAVVDQARGIASLFGEKPLVNHDATAEGFLNRLEKATHVHIAAHGSAFDAAPSFHHLYLGGGETDERVYAHNIERKDLRGVKLVTLSACESSLGRFDMGDNLWGLPGSFLRAGAKTIIGCLWPVHPDVAEAFFQELYRAVAQGAGTLAAFRGAQQATRAKYPQYRDWGAFSFLGEWREAD